MTQSSGSPPTNATNSPAPRGLLGLLSDLIFALPLRILLTACVALAAGAWAADSIYPQALPEIAKEVTLEVRRDVGKSPSRAKLLQLLAKHNLSWCYITDNGRINQATAVAPDLSAAPQKSGPVDLKTGHYYESVSEMGHGQALHLGFLAGPVLFPALASLPGGWTAPLAPGYLAILYAFIIAVFLLAMHWLVSKPLWKVGRFAPLLLTSDDETVDQNLNVPLALSEVYRVVMGYRFIRSQFNQHEFERISKEHALRRQRTDLEAEKESLSKEFDDHIVKTHRNISELYTKESEEEFLSALGRELDAISLIDLICQKALDRLNDKFPTSITMGAFFVTTNKNNRYRLQGSIGFDTSSIEYLDDMDHHQIASEILSTGKYLSIDKRSFKDYGLEQIGNMKGLYGAVYLPLQFQGKNIGMMAIYHDAPHTSANERLRILRNVAELCSRELHRVTIYRQELEAARTDALTGLYNKKFFYELVPQLIEKASANPTEHPISFVMIDGDDFKQINDTYGHQIGDQMLQEVGSLIRNTTRMTEYGVRHGRPKDYVIRYGGEEFLVIMENTGSGQAFNVAERIRHAVESKGDWPGGIARWTISLGISTYPTDAKNVDELMLLADASMYYVKEELGKNKTALSANVPKGFRARKYSAIGGELGIFDPAALLQSIASAHKSGVLTVVAPDGRKVWMLYENGHPIQAKLGKFAGRNAIVEFVTTFDDGKFNFQEIQSGNRTGTGKKLANLTGSFNIQRGLERCLMDAALAQDNFSTARRTIKDVNVYFVPAPGKEFERKLIALKTKPDAPNAEELDVISSIAQQIDDSCTLGDIFKALDHIPTAILWRSAAVMVQEGLVKMVEADEHAITTLKLRSLPDPSVPSSARLLPEHDELPEPDVVSDPIEAGTTNFNP
jgi:diguanylate cyclase (GGDEF)-like protein